MMCFRYCNTCLNFSLSSLMILVTLVHRNDMAGSILGLPLFATHSNFADMEWKMSASLFSILVELPSMFSRPLFDGDDNFVLSSSPKKSIDSSMQSFTNKDSFPSSKNSMSIPSNLCLFPLDTVRLPKFSDIFQSLFCLLIHQRVIPCCFQHTTILSIACL